MGAESSRSSHEASAVAGGSTPSDEEHVTTSQPVEPAVPHDLQALANKLDGTLPGQTPVVDLQGRTLSGQLEKDLFLVHTGLILRNGVLQLPPEMYMEIRSDGVQLQDLAITRQASGAGPCTIFIKAKQVIIKDCKIKYEPCPIGSRDAVTHAAVYVAPGSSASIHGCIVSGAPGSAVVVQGPHCNVEVHNSHVHNNHSAGFHVQGVGGVLSIGSHCMSSKNGSGGFSAAAGGKLILGDGCKAVGNQVGFAVIGYGSQARIGQGCRAEGNRESGFLCYDGGAKMFVGERCEAISNGISGFCSTNSKCSSDDRSDTLLCLRKGCRAVCNGGSGIVATRGATIVTGQGCIASSNKGCGFIVTHKGSVLRVEFSIKAVGNGAAGFMAHTGGRLEGGPEGACDWEPT